MLLRVLLTGSVLIPTRLCPQHTAAFLQPIIQSTIYNPAPKFLRKTASQNSLRQNFSEKLYLRTSCATISWKNCLAEPPAPQFLRKTVSQNLLRHNFYEKLSLRIFCATISVKTVSQNPVRYNFCEKPSLEIPCATICPKNCLSETLAPQFY
jgi:hypothetical protein